MDQFPRLPEYLEPGVVARFGFATVLDQLKRKLTHGGTLNILQPNYRRAYGEYFDDYTHVAVYSDISLCDFLRANGYHILECRAACNSGFDSCLSTVALEAIREADVHQSTAGMNSCQISSHDLPALAR